MAKVKKNLEQGELTAEPKKLSTEQRKYISNKIKEITGGAAIKIINVRTAMKKKLGGNVNQLYAHQMPEIEAFLAEAAQKELQKNDKAACVGKEFMSKQSKKNNPKIVLPSVAEKKAESAEKPMKNELTCREVKKQVDQQIRERLDEIGVEFMEFMCKDTSQIKLSVLNEILTELKEIKAKLGL